MRLLMGISKNRHGTYYAIKKVPAHLQEAVARVLNNDKPRQIWLKRSLGTKDIATANRSAKAVLIEFDLTFERARGLITERARPLRTSLSPVEIKRIAEYHYARKLASNDEFVRTAPEQEREWRDLEPDAGPWVDAIPKFGLSKGQLLDIAVNMPVIVAQAKEAFAKGDIEHVTVQLENLLNTFQINLDERSAAYRDLGLEVLRAEVKGLLAIQQRDAGEPIETPSLPPVGITSTSGPTGETLAAAFVGWKRQTEPAPGTLTEYERAIRLFVELHGDLPVSQIRKSHVRHFREALQAVPRRRIGKLLSATLPELAEWGRAHAGAQKTTAGTVNKLLGGVQAVAVWADKNGMVPDDAMWSDPFARMRLAEGEAVRGGAPFELEDLQTIFSAPVFTKGERPEGGQGDAAFWLPLLALFTGGRLHELAALRASDVAHNVIIGAKVFAIVKDRKAGKRLKTERSERAVPLHPQLLEFGFLDYVAARTKAHGAKAWLLPKVAPETTGARAFSKWFGRYIGEHGVTDAKKVFHSFRHNFTDALRLAGVAEEVNKALLGHTDNSVHGRYGAKEKAQRFRHRLAEAVASVEYKGLDLSRVRNYRASGEGRRAARGGPRKHTSGRKGD
jgi:integrase